MGVFGEKLRKRREQRGLELDAISSTTKISIRMLRALEDEHFDQLPGGVFNKGFVRAYARQIGLDEEEAVADYLAALRESQIQQQSILPDFRAAATKPTLPEPLPRHNPPASHDDGDDHLHELRPEDRRKHGRRHEDRREEDRRDEDRSHHDPDALLSTDSSRQASAANHAASRFRQKYPAGDSTEAADEFSASIPWGKLALALLLVTLALAFWNFRRHAQPTAPAASPAAASNQSPAPASAPAAIAHPSAPAASQTGRPASPGKNLSAGTVSPAPISAVPTATPTKPVPPNPTASAPAATASAASPLPSPTTTANASGSKPAANPHQPDSRPPATHAAAPAAVAKPPSTLTLLIRAEETTWVALIADGKPIAHETLIAPAQTSIRASREIVVRAGNAAGISFVLNGKETPAQGKEGEVKTYIFDATGVHIAPQTQPPAQNH